MAETLGSLCDKLTIVKLKQWHTQDGNRLASLEKQELQLREEIDEFLAGAVRGAIPADRLTFAANKVYKQEGNTVPEVVGTLGDVVSRLAHVNCTLWQDQEKVYDFQHVPAGEKDAVVKRLALLNLERTRCIDEIDQFLRHAVVSRNGVK